MTSGLSSQDWGTLSNALDDAIGYREPETGSCPGCADRQLCEDHAGDADAVSHYKAVRDRLCMRLGRQADYDPEAG